MSLQWCAKCQTYRPLSDFTPGARNRNGQPCKVCTRQYVNAKRQRHRREVLIHYSDDPPRCTCCGELRPEFLVIDHVDGNGSEHRKQIDKRGKGALMFEWIRSHGYPPGFRILCANCNTAIGTGGICPHEREREAACAGIFAL